MKVIMTATASESLWPIYSYHLTYNQAFADGFQYEIDRYIFESLSHSPLLGRVYHEPRGIRRLLFQKRYAIYYVILNETIFVLFILDTRMEANQDIEDYGLSVDDIIE